MDRPSSWELMPFFELAMSQTDVIHLSSGIGESSKIVPSFTENCRLHALSLHCHSRRVLTYPSAVPPQFGHSGPLGQRSLATKAFATSGSAKYRIASMRVRGRCCLGLVSLTMH